MNVAIIDLGTNTFNLLVAEVSEGKVEQVLYEMKIPVKLGEGGFRGGVIAPAAFRRGIAAMQEYATVARRFNVKEIYALATSAVRDAGNRGEFMEEIKRVTSIGVHTISGEEEAGYIYHGVRNALDIGIQPALIMDIGGGSVEFIIGTQKEILWKDSFNIGVARLQQVLPFSDPVLPHEAEEMNRYLEERLQPLFGAAGRFPVRELIGSSGSFDTFAEMIEARNGRYDILKNCTEYVFRLEDFFSVHQQLRSSTLEERLAFRGLVNMRADMIVVASLMVNYILHKLSIRKMRLSSYSLKEGALYKWISGARFRV